MSIPELWFCDLPTKPTLLTTAVVGPDVDNLFVGGGLVGGGLVGGGVVGGIDVVGELLSTGSDRRIACRSVSGTLWTSREKSKRRKT